MIQSKTKYITKFILKILKDIFCNYSTLMRLLIFRFKPGRDIGSLEALLDRLSLRLDLPRGARHIFSMDGDRKISLDELEDGASYVVSSYKTFKVSDLY